MLNYLGDIVFLCVGIFAAGWGWIRVKKARLISDIPTSKVRSVAMGLAELKGVARRKFSPPLESRLTKTPCVWFRFLIEAERRDPKGRTRWERVDGGESSNYFYLDDGTGRLLVDPLGAEVILPYDYRYVDITGTLYNSRKVRYTEWYIEEGDSIYVIGTVKKFTDAADDKSARFNEKIRMLKSDPSRMKALDRDGDGKVSCEEWDDAIERLKEEMLKEDLAIEQSTNASDDSTSYYENLKDDIVVGAPERNSGGENIFIISDRSEKDLYFRLSVGGSAAFIVGFCIIIWSLLSLSGRLGAGFVFPAVPWKAILALALS